MTIHDAIASISDSPSSDLTISACINALKIDSPPPNCDADDFLTEELILKFCQNLLADLKMLTLAARSTPEMAERMLAALSQNAILSLCKPYRKALEEQKFEISDLRAQMNTLRAANEKDVEKLRADKSEKILEVTQDLNASLLSRLDRAPVMQICVPDSVSRRETWEKVKLNPTTSLNNTLPDYADRKITNKAIEPVVAAKYIEEAAMYVPVTRCVADYLTFRRTKNHPGTKVVDTHNRYYLEGQAPDITIMVQDVAEVDSASVVAIIELKHKSRNPLGDECFGQVYDYLRKLGRAQPNRRKIVALLSNLTYNHIIIHDSPNHQTVNIMHFLSVGFAKALRFLKYCILHDSITLPSIPSFSSDLHVLELRLGNPVFSVVGVFSIPKKFGPTNAWVSSDPLPVGDKMVVKRTSNVPSRRPRASFIPSLTAVRSPKTVEVRPVEAEIGILLAILRAGPHAHLPKLIYHSGDKNEFGITPLGEPCNIYTMKQPQAKQILHDILDALQWLHKHDIIHRDVRWDNIVIVKGRGVLIDFGAALIQDGRMHEFEGGIVCAPSRVIGQFDRQYHPSAADDCLAWVLLLNAILAPTRWAALRSDEIMTPGSEAERRMRALWSALTASRIWGPGVMAAKNKEYKVMSEMLDLLVLL